MDIRSKVLTALRWTVAVRFGAQLVSWAITIVVIRLLSPGDYGLMAMAMVFLSFLYLSNTLGLDAVLVQKSDLDEITRGKIFGLVILTNLFFFLVLFLAAQPIAVFFSEPRLVPIVRVLSARFILLIFETLPQAQLERQIDFKNMSIVDLVTMIFGSVTTLALAFAGMGVWALVWGHLTTTLSRMIGLNIISPCLCRPSFSLRGMRTTISFGGFATFDRILWFIFAETDKFIGGKLLGKEILGFYAVANHLASLPINKLAGLINAVAFPAFSRVQFRLDKVDAYLLKAVRSMSIVGFPVFLGISSVAPELTALFLGEKWQEVALPLQILALVMPIRMISTLLPPLLWGIGRPDISATNFLIAAIIMPFAFFVGAQWGAVGLATAWLSAYPVIFLISVVRAAHVLELRASDFMAQMLRPALAGIGMYGAVMTAKLFAIGQAGDILHFAQLVMVGISAYTALIIILHREGVRETVDLLRSQ